MLPTGATLGGFEERRNSDIRVGEVVVVGHLEISEKIFFKNYQRKSLPLTTVTIFLDV